MVKEVSRNGRFGSLMREVGFTAMAAGATLVFALTVDLLMPRIELLLKTSNSLLEHRRGYQTEPTGGAIVYYPVSNEKVPEKEQLNALKQDLEILSRRFQLGKFEMVEIPGSSQSDAVKVMVPLKDQYKYNVEIKDNSAILHIATANPQALKSLQGYLQYLKERWMVTSGDGKHS